MKSNNMNKWCKAVMSETNTPRAGTNQFGGMAQSAFALRLEEILPDLTKSEAAIARYLMLNESAIGLETGASLAAKTNVSEITISRFLRRLGYKGMQALKSDLSTAHVSNGLDVQGRHLRLLNDDLSQSLKREAEAILDLAAQIAKPEWNSAIDAIASADEVSVTGFQTIRGLAEDFARRLSIVRGSVRYVSAHDAGLAEWIPSKRRANDKKVLVLIDIIPYAREAEPMAKLCVDMGIELVVITDETNNWAYPHTPHVFHASTRMGTFLESNGPMATLLNIALHEVAGRDPERVKQRLDSWPAIMRGLSLW